MRTRLYSIKNAPEPARTEVGYLLDEDVFAGTQSGGGTQAGYVHDKDVYASYLGYSGRQIGYVSDSSVYAGRRNTGNLIGYLLNDTVYAGTCDEDAKPVGYVEGDDPERGAAALLLLLGQPQLASA